MSPASPAHERLCSWAGLTPRHRESDTVLRRGHITKQGSKLVRWAAVEAVHSLPLGTKLRADRDRIVANRGKGIGKVAAARISRQGCLQWDAGSRRALFDAAYRVALRTRRALERC